MIEKQRVVAPGERAAGRVFMMPARPI